MIYIFIEKNGINWRRGTLMFVILVSRDAMEIKDEY